MSPRFADIAHARSRLLPAIGCALLLPVLLAAQLRAQPGDEAAPPKAPARELRGVWLTTLAGLDWPRPPLQGQPDRQRAELVAIIDEAARMHFNAIFFQVRSRGNALYRSSLEPWATELTGTPGRDPGWDPLAVAIDECHRRGMELHAWFNVFRVWTQGEPPRTDPLHVGLLHPSWVRRYGTDLWLDPGIPVAREYTLQVLEELVRGYDLDGIHFDYCRYPERDFEDAETYAQFGRGRPKDDWRRDNVSAFVREAYERCTILRPGLIVGSAPIGIYHSIPGAHGWEGRNAVSQDSRRWMAEGYQDYVAPQIYWGLTSSGSKIDFEALVDDWKRGASGRQVYAGVAAYKDNVKPHLAGHIDAARTKSADGQVYFRFEHVRGEDFGGRYAALALPPPMTWRDAVAPNPPRDFTVQHASGMTHVMWTRPLPAPDGDTAARYTVYRRCAGTGEAVLVAVLPGAATSYDDHDACADASYTVRSVDRFRNESGEEEQLPAVAVARSAPSDPSLRPAAPRLSVPQPYGEHLLLVGYLLPQGGRVRLRLIDDEGANLRTLVDTEQSAGLHLVGIERDRLPDGAVTMVLEAGGARTARPIFTED
jgi:uncharacterized lipoprotein YddW (UPF0748 family)